MEMKSLVRTSRHDRRSSLRRLSPHCLTCHRDAYHVSPSYKYSRKSATSEGPHYSLFCNEPTYLPGHLDQELRIPLAILLCVMSALQSARELS